MIHDNARIGAQIRSSALNLLKTARTDSRDTIEQAHAQNYVRPGKRKCSLGLSPEAVEHLASLGDDSKATRSPSGGSVFGFFACCKVLAPSAERFSPDAERGVGILKGMAEMF